MYLELKTKAPITLCQTPAPTAITITTTIKTVTELNESQKLFTNRVRYMEKPTTSQINVTLEPLQPIDRLLGTEDQ